MTIPEGTDDDGIAAIIAAFAAAGGSPAVPVVVNADATTIVRIEDGEVYVAPAADTHGLGQAFADAWEAEFGR